jgi:hypothetical protein
VDYCLEFSGPIRAITEHILHCDERARESNKQTKKRSSTALRLAPGSTPEPGTASDDVQYSELARLARPFCINVLVVIAIAITRVSIGTPRGRLVRRQSIKCGYIPNNAHLRIPHLARPPSVIRQATMIALILILQRYTSLKCEATTFGNGYRNVEATSSSR